MSFRIGGLDPAVFRHLNGSDDAGLARHGARRCVADRWPGFRDRIGLRDIPLGQAAILLNHEYHAVDTPYRASRAIFIQPGASRAVEPVDTVPEAMQRRAISLRASDAAGDRVEAELADGRAPPTRIERLFHENRVAMLRAHHAGPGCFAARIERS